MKRTSKNNPSLAFFRSGFLQAFDWLGYLGEDPGFFDGMITQQHGMKKSDDRHSSEFRIVLKFFEAFIHRPDQTDHIVDQNH